MSEDINPKKNSKIFIVSGGTGGHIIPAYCLAKFLQQKNYQIFMLGDKKVKNYLKPADNFKNLVIFSSQFPRSLIEILKFFSKVFVGIFQSLFYIIKERPEYVFTFGGYATFPTLIASVLLRRKIIIHEQNAHLGKVNRIFAKFATKIATSFKNTSGIKSEFLPKVFFTGNPIREEIIELNKVEYSLPNFGDNNFIENKLGYNVLLNSDFDNAKSSQNLFNILVIGGSGGAKIFSDILPKVFFNFSDNIKEHIKIYQQCRSELAESTFYSYKSFNINIEVSAFFEDMGELIKRAHLVICRAGSSSIFEFCCAHKPMIIVPFAKSADDHQQKNANFLEENGAGIVIKEQEFTIQKVSEILNQLFIKNDVLYKMSKNAGKVAIINATDKLWQLIK